jgi:hypothetical protein
MSSIVTCLPQANAAERLFAVTRNGREIVCELLNFGTAGVEVQFLSDREIFYGQRLGTYELAVAWAEGERRAWGWTLADDPAQ